MAQNKNGDYAELYNALLACLWATADSSRAWADYAVDYTFANSDLVTLALDERAIACGEHDYVQQAFEDEYPGTFPNG